MTWVNAVTQGILLGGLYALFATGLSISFGVMRLVNLAHGDLAVLAAFVSWSIVDRLGVGPFATLALVVPALGLGGYLLQRGVLDFVVSADPLRGILVTFGLAVVLQNLLLEHYSANAKGLDAGGLETASFRLTDQLAVGWLPLLTLGVAVAVLGGLSAFLRWTRTGRAFRAVADDLRTARLMGIDTRHVFGLAMALALATVALGGVFLGIRTTFSPGAGPGLLLVAFEAVIIGGLGSLWGTLVGAMVIGVAQTVGAQIEPGWSILLGHLVFLAVLAVRPQGLFGRVGRT